MMKNAVLVLLLLAVVLPTECLRAQEAQKHRLLVLSDIEADPDDTQSLIRLLLYANRIDIEGVVATTSVHQKTRVAPESMERVIRAYGKVQPNLNMHEPGFPAAERLLGLVKRGVAEYGMRGVGKDKDSEGSNLILELLEKSDERPLWVYPEAGSYREPIDLGAENQYRLFIRAPRVKTPQTAHFILSVTDKGKPPLTRYKRVIVNIVPFPRLESGRWKIVATPATARPACNLSGLCFN